ncbi:tripartite tricarboxylate transporter substrate binding protein [Hydrogenophaga palleronii]|uniref:tripartite tricarboxylate transporter substrate binding protein n=1 Tax=Hydrogenophaga palleronii TaxID=65655 RepID=UPI000826AE21|nr:tripartite tricarboxylate transporter substrate binding protein [Hydrogenophaga palleronii]
MAVPQRGAANQFPERPITLVVPYSAGGIGDGIARAVADSMTEGFGRPVIVENKPGAANLIATQHVAKAAPDGYTLLLTNQNFVIYPALNPQASFDPIRAFVPLAHVADGCTVLVVGSQWGINSWADFVRYGQANPGGLSFGITGKGSVSHIYSALMADKGGIDLLPVSYRGEAPALTDVLGSTLMATVITPGTFRANVSSGRIRGLAVAAPQRHPDLPDIPSFAEIGISVSPNWWGIFAPAGTPADISARISAQVNHAMQQPKVRARLTQAGMTPIVGTATQFATLVRDDLQNFKSMIAKYRITAE